MDQMAIKETWVHNGHTIELTEHPETPQGHQAFQVKFPDGKHDIVFARNINELGQGLNRFKATVEVRQEKPSLARSELRPGMSYRALMKEEVEKGLWRDLAVGASLAATIAAGSTAHQKKKEQGASITQLPIRGEMTQNLASEPTALDRRIAATHQKLMDLRTKPKRK
jgi:hypothetical protein